MQKHSERIDEYVKKLSFNGQMYGCGSGSPRMDFTLEKIHEEMYASIITAFEVARNKIQTIIDEI